MSDGTLGRPVLLGPATQVVDALVFGAAPDTQALSETAHGQRRLILTDGVAKLYERKDYILDRDTDGNIVSITSLIDGYLDAGGNANATYTGITFAADDLTEEYRSHSQGFRFTVDGARSGTGAATVQIMGRTVANAAYNDLGASFVVAAGESRTIFFDETNDILAADLSAVTGDVDVYIQDVL